MGCVLATNGCCLPYHLSLCRTQRQFRAAEILCQADDTYMRHPRRVGVGGTEQTAADAFERLQTNRLEDCGCVSNDAKIKAICPAGGVDGIPAAILEQQEGEIQGVKVVGTFVAPDTDAGRQSSTSETSCARRSPA